MSKKLYEEELIRLQEISGMSRIFNAAKDEGKAFISPATLASNVFFSAGFALGIPMVGAIFKFLRAQISVAHKKCGSQGKGPGYAICVAKENIRNYNLALQQLNTARSKCSNNIKCKNTIDMKIEEMRRKVLIAARELDEAQQEVSAAKAENSGYRKINEIGISGLAGGAGKIAIGTGEFLAGQAVTMVLFGLLDRMMRPVYQKTREIFSEAERRCSGIDSGPAKDMCKAKVKIEALQQQVMALNRVVNICNSKAGSSNSKCLKYASRLGDIKNQIRAHRDNVEVYQQALRAQSMTPNNE